MIILQQPALYSTIQDQGRFFHAHEGISPSGANDAMAAYWGNRILANDDQAAVLELIQPPARLLMVSGQYVVFTGAETDIRCQGQRIPLYARCWLPAGSVVEIARPWVGSTVYLSVVGGFDTPRVLGSRSYDPRLGLMPLGKNSFLPTFTQAMLTQTTPTRAEHIQVAQRYVNGARYVDLTSRDLDVVAGADFVLLSPEAQQQLMSQRFKVSSQSNRMGIRLHGEALSAPTQQCLSAGVCRGAVQLPPQGLPILLAAEHQTTGGYPLVLHVAPYHGSRMAQLQAGEDIGFSLVTIEQMNATLHHWQQRWRFGLRQIASSYER